MGYMRHNAIIVSGSYGDFLVEAHAVATRGGLAVSDVVRSPVNGVETFLVAPDGSKEGWSESEQGDALRDWFIAHLEGLRYEDGSSPLSWVEVQYGDDDLETKIVRDSDEECRGSAMRGEE